MAVTAKARSQTALHIPTWSMVGLSAVCVALAGCGSTSSSAPTVAQPVSHTQSTPTAISTTDKAAPSSKGPVAFSRNGHTARGDTIHLEGRFGPILPSSESDVDQTVLRSCPETDGRELVRRIDLTFAITSGLAGEVRIAPPIVSVNKEEGAEEIRNLNFVVAAPEGTSCHKGLGEENWSSPAFVDTDEYVDAGASGNSMSRLGLRGLLTRVAEGTVRYAIVRDYRGCPGRRGTSLAAPGESFRR